MRAVPAVDVVDETFLVVPPKTLAAVFAEPASWAKYWPDLVLSVYLDRGEQGLRWTVGGPLSGTMEVWLEAVLDGTMLHYFLRADFPEGVVRTPRQAQKERQARQFAAKQAALDLKLILEDGRPAGVPPTG
ncbi:MAG TPA: polyketide cyclase / dehydrase and lipid transport [Pseudonocardiaceae bacterium]|nr:polyketide cyclase / dehydrase and lipid transport [Pseudonocardiaceae bacterium]